MTEFVITCQSELTPEGSYKVERWRKLVRCKACGDCRQDGYCERWHISVKPDFFCADGDDGNLQEGTT